MQQCGHRTSICAIATASKRRIVAIELGTWRWGLIGGAAGSVTTGKGRFFEPRGGTWFRGGNRLPFGDEESIGRDGQCAVVMEASPSPALIMPEPDLLLEVLIIALDAPAHFD